MIETNSTSEDTLTVKQQLFCELYTSDKEFFGNGVQSYIEAYDFDMNRPRAYNTVAAAASRLLASPKILRHIDRLLELRGLNDAYVDKQLEFLITQHADYKVKLGAIREYNALRKRIQQRLDLTSGGEKVTAFQSLTTDELRKLAAK